MKKTVSFSLEEDIIKSIEQYQKNNNLSSRSVALERMILNFKENISEEYIENIIKKYMKVNNDENVVTKTKKDILDNVINDSFNNMPE